MSSIAYILGDPEDEHNPPSYYAQDSKSHPSPHNTKTLAYRQSKPESSSSTTSKPSGSGSKSSSHSKHSSSRSKSSGKGKHAVSTTEPSTSEIYGNFDTPSSHYTMDPRTGYETSPGHQYYPSIQHGHGGSRGGRDHPSSRDGFYDMEGGAVGFDSAPGTVMMHAPGVVFDGSLDNGQYGAMPMDSGVMHQHADLSGDLSGDMSGYAGYHDDNDVTPKTGRPSRAKKGKPVHDCSICQKVFTRAEHLRRHQLSHWPPRYICQFPGCERRFNRPDLLTRHQQRHRNGEEQPPQDADDGGADPSDSPGSGQMSQPAEGSWMGTGAVGSTIYSPSTRWPRRDSNDCFNSSINDGRSSELTGRYGRHGEPSQGMGSFGGHGDHDGRDGSRTRGGNQKETQEGRPYQHQQPLAQHHNPPLDAAPGSYCATSTNHADETTTKSRQRVKSQNRNKTSRSRNQNGATTFAPDENSRGSLANGASYRHAGPDNTQGRLMTTASFAGLNSYHYSHQDPTSPFRHAQFQHTNADAVGRQHRSFTTPLLTNETSYDNGDSSSRNQYQYHHDDPLPRIGWSSSVSSVNNTFSSDTFSPRITSAVSPEVGAGLTHSRMSPLVAAFESMPVHLMSSAHGSANQTVSWSLRAHY